MSIPPHKITLWVKVSLIPRPPPFLPSICVHNNTQEQKIGEKRGRPGSIHHVSGRKVDVGREGHVKIFLRSRIPTKNCLMVLNRFYVPRFGDLE